MKVGKIRIKLAALLSEALDMEVMAEDIHRIYSTELLDLACWSAHPKQNKMNIFSWDSMTDIVNRGKIHIVERDHTHILVC